MCGVEEVEDSFHFTMKCSFFQRWREEFMSSVQTISEPMDIEDEAAVRVALCLVTPRELYEVIMEKEDCDLKKCDWWEFCGPRIEQQCDRYLAKVYAIRVKNHK